LEKKKFRLKFMFQEIDLAPGPFLVGRSPSCNLTLEDPLVSRQHARITVSAEAATIEDMGSRNGTLINSEPVFDSVHLNNKDRIRIGSHEMVFLEESRFPSRPLRSTGALVTCPGCKMPFAAGASDCPHCGAPIVPSSTCSKCKLQIGPADAFCIRCGTPVAHQGDTTIPIQLGGATGGWTSNLVNEVIHKALMAGRPEHAARLLDGKIEEFELRSGRGAVDLASLVEISSLSTIVGTRMRDASRLTWVIDQWTKVGLAMPADSFETIVSEAGGWFPIGEHLAGYLESLRRKQDLSDNEQQFIEQLVAVIQGDVLR